MNANEQRMLEILIKGKQQFQVLAVKAEFEAEGTRTDELLRLLEIARRAGVQVALKIGGCEAVRDLIECKQFGVDYVIAPMVETPYALSKYIDAKNKVYPGVEREQVRFLFNIETFTTYENLARMTAMAAADGGCDGMVFGRVDFAGSMDAGRKEINSDLVTDYVLSVARSARDAGLELVVGGGVSSDAVDALRRVRQIGLHRFETRKVVFDAAVLDGPNIEDALALAIEFELLWLHNKRDYYSVIGREDDERIAMLEARSAAVQMPANVLAERRAG